MFSNKTLIITGGTGTFGNAALNRFLDTEVSEIRIFSRDEKKQHEMRLFITIRSSNFILEMCGIQRA